MVGERGFEPLTQFLNPVDSVVLSCPPATKIGEQKAILFPSCSQIRSLAKLSRNATILRQWAEESGTVQQWLGHESLATTQKYLEPSKETEKVLAKMRLPF